MFDVTSERSYIAARTYLEQVKEKMPINTHIVLCCNKVDCKNRTILSKDIKLHQEFNCRYYDVSAKSNYNYEKPFQYIIDEMNKD